MGCTGAHTTRGTGHNAGSGTKQEAFSNCTRKELVCNWDAPSFYIRVYRHCTK